MEQRQVLSIGTALNRELIRRRLAESSDIALRHGFLGAGPGDAPPAIPSELREAAVLIPIIDRLDGLTVLFTKRTPHLSHHAGQVAFPGGRIEPGDVDPVAAALRETHEEVGLDPAGIDILGRLPGHVTGTGFSIMPIVGMITPPFTLVPDPAEVAETFEVPLDFLRDPANRRSQVRTEPRLIRFYSIPYAGHNIWGATARIMVTLTDLLDSGA